jgi:dephospho-CoA kinase
MSGARTRPVVVGLTGGIGTGKSNVLSTLVSLGAEGIDADQVAREVVEPGGAAYDALLAVFGEGYLSPDGQVDRHRLGEHVFGDPAALAQLEAIVHPAVAEVIRRRVSVSEAPMVVIEAIKLLEAGLSRRLCDVVWVTRAAPRRQLARLVASRGMTPEEVRRRIEAQMPQSEMAAQADRVIDTAGTFAETGLQALAGWAALELPWPEPEVRRCEVADAAGIAAVLNSVVIRDGQTVIDRTFTPVQERAFLRRLPERAFLMVACLGNVLAGFQVVEPYASYTRSMDHVATVGSYVAEPARGCGLGTTLSRAAFAYARGVGFRKLVASIRADNVPAQAFYQRLGFRPCGRLVRQVMSDGEEWDLLLFEMFL